MFAAACAETVPVEGEGEEGNEPVAECDVTTPTICASQTSYKVCVNGSFQVKNCAVGQNCVNGLCVNNGSENPPIDNPPVISECLDNQTECFGEAVRTCVNGKWVTTSCANGSTCVNGQCVVPLCNNDFAPVCEGNAIKTCVNNAFVLSECAEGTTCKDAQCVVPSVQDECLSTFVSVCEGNAIKSCVNGKFSLQTCLADQTCENSEQGAACIQSKVCEDSETSVCAGNKIKSCVDGKYSYFDCGQDTCQDSAAGASCVIKGECEDSMIPTCEGNKVKSCKNGAFKYDECAAGTACQASALGAQCIATAECNSKFVPTCDGNQIKSCVNGKFSYEDCGANECTVGVNGAVCQAHAVIPTVGDKCDESLVEVCDGNTGYYCKDNKVTTFTCEDSVPCAVRAADNYSDCAESCVQGSPDKIECLNYYGYPLAATYSCDATTSGSYASFMSAYEFCDSECIDGVGCKAVEACDDSYVESCDGNVGYYCDENQVTTFECDASAPCAVRAADNYSDCAESCQKGDPSKVTCLDYYGYQLAVTYNCEATTSGSYASFMGDYEVCEDGCVEGKGCKNNSVVIPTVGDPCDDSLVEVCDGNTGYYCSEEKVTTFECDETMPCAVRASDNYSDCAESCVQGSPDKIECLNYYGYPLAATYSCDATTSGSYASFMSAYEFCDGDCIEGTGCKPVEKCDDSYVESCVGNVGYYCDNGVVETLECDASTPCAVRAEDNYADCAESCEKGDPDEIVCINYYGTIYSGRFTCSLTSNGTYASFLNGGYKACSNGCTNGLGCN